ncbi:hypothetical protein WT08_17300 [Burkholderia sp. MSMB1552]|nr:hypothetical protein WT08_17300 [Burkholderia sp. MSMB1552]KWZ55346.1 hypothetical protein WS92_05055 [Burkholderia sp. MSMB1588]
MSTGHSSIPSREALSRRFIPAPIPSVGWVLVFRTAAGSVALGDCLPIYRITVRPVMAEIFAILKFKLDRNFHVI